MKTKSFTSVVLASALAFTGVFALAACDGESSISGETQSAASTTYKFGDKADVGNVSVSVIDGTSMLESGANSETGRLQLIISAIPNADDPNAAVDISGLYAVVTDVDGGRSRMSLDADTASPGDVSAYYLDESVSIDKVKSVEVVDGSASALFVK